VLPLLWLLLIRLLLLLLLLLLVGCTHATGPRCQSDAVLLPNGKVVVINGGEVRPWDRGEYEHICGHVSH
jgi:hypothetical protein